MSQSQFWAAIVIFAATYAVIAFARLPRLRLDRPGAAVCGAVAMVGCGVLSFDQAWQAIDSRTIVLLLGMMILNVLLEDSGFFELAARGVLSGTRSPLGLLAGLTMLSGILSALFLNDTVCLMLTAPTVVLVRRAGLPLVPFLLALAMGSNVGSVMTVVGNPQNMLIGVYSDWSYAGFLLWMAPVGLLGLAVLIGVLFSFYRRDLPAVAAVMPASDLPPATVDRPLLAKSLVVMAGVLIGFVAIGELAVVAMAGAAILLLISGRPSADVLRRVNWVLLAFFAGLFVVVHALEQTGLVAQAAESVRPLYGDSLATQIPVFSAATVLGSNVVSNVPLVVLARGIVPHLIEPDLMWLVLAMASTLGGNLTIPGSVATLIVLETVRQMPGEHETISYWEFLRVGIPVTLLTVAVGALVLAAEFWIAGFLQRSLL